MRYADTLLVQGEEVALRTRQHWLAFVINARFGFILWIVAVLLLAAGSMFGLTGVAAQIIGVAVLVMFVVGLAIVAARIWQWWAQDYMITNRRLMKVWGVFNKRSVDSSLEHINDARLDQSFFGRLLNYGHLEILTAAEESALDDYDMIRDPKGFKKIMLGQKHALDQRVFQTPTPPLRAPAAPAMEQAPMQPTAPMRPIDAMDAAGAPGESWPTQSVPAEPPAPAPAAAATDESLEITQTLARLADLRDRGAISPEEYEAKKQELLDRL